MFDVCLINSYLVFSFWFLLFAFFYDNVTAIRCTYIHTYIHTSIHTYIHTYIHKLYFSSNLRVAIVKANFFEKTITKITEYTTTY